MPTYFAAGFLTDTGTLQSPTADGTSGQVLQTDGSGQLSFVDAGASSPLELTASGVGETPLTVNAAASQTANLIDVRSSADAILAAFDSTGRLGIGKQPTVALDVAFDAKMRRVAIGTNAVTGGAQDLLIRANGTQPLFELQLSDGTVVAQWATKQSDNSLLFDAETAGAGIEFRTSGNTTRLRIAPDGGIVMSALPTADPVVAGELWNDAGTLKVSAG